MDSLACNYDLNAILDDGSCIYPGQPYQYNIAICDGESIEIAGNIYDTTGLYIDSLVSFLGCDSLVFTNLIVNPNIAFTNNQTICIGETYTMNGNVYDSTGSYVDSLLTIDGCDSIITLNLTITENPVVNISYVNNDLSAIVTGGVSPYSYQWNGPINSANAIVTPIVSGNYCVQVTDYNECNSGQICENLTINGVIEMSINNDLILYPNPASEQLTIDFTANAKSIKVYNMLGELIVEQKITNSQSSVRLAVYNWKSATYNVQLHKKDGSVIQKTFNVVK